MSIYHNIISPTLSTPTLIALSYKTYSNHHHIQPFSAHWFWAHTCSPNINSKQHITIYSSPSILHHIALWLFTSIPESLSTVAHSSSCKTWILACHTWCSASAPTLLKWMEYHQVNRSASWMSITHYAFLLNMLPSLNLSKSKHASHSINVQSISSVFGCMEALYAKSAWVRSEDSEENTLKLMR